MLLERAGDFGGVLAPMLTGERQAAPEGPAGGNVVLLSEAEYNNMQENLFVRRDKKAYARLIKSIGQLKAGQGKVRELIDD